MEYPISGYLKGGWVRGEVKGSIEVLTILVVVVLIWKSFISYASEVNFWEAEVMTKLWYLICLVFSIYASGLIMSLVEGRHQLLRKQQND